MNGQSLGAKYEIVRLIGEGGMGSVYEGVETATGRRVAIKMINDAASESVFAPLDSGLRRFHREARAMRSLRTPHIVSVLDAGVWEGRSGGPPIVANAKPTSGAPYIVMELLEGEDLQRAIDRLGPLPPPLALKIVAQACLGLEAAHAAGIVHRDIKPANLFLARRHGGEIVVKILDFGIAKIVRGGIPLESCSTLTESGTLLGSPLYMSPEQLSSSKLSDHRTDIWSIGSVLDCALAGRAPFADIKSIIRLIHALCYQAPPPLEQRAPWVSREVAGVVERALQIDPARRFPSAIAMLDALRPFLPGGLSLSDEMFARVGPLPPLSKGAERPSINALAETVRATSPDAGHCLHQAG